MELKGKSDRELIEMERELFSSIEVFKCFSVNDLRLEQEVYCELQTGDYTIQDNSKKLIIRRE